MENEFASFSQGKSKLSKEDYYLNEEGFIIFTEEYHSKRGYCCKSNCKHCPYGYDKNTGEIRKK
jgi:hypothetical protein